jgi:hypothetical protein
LSITIKRGYGLDGIVRNVAAQCEEHEIFYLVLRPPFLGLLIVTTLSA